MPFLKGINEPGRMFVGSDFVIPDTRSASPARPNGGMAAVTTQRHTGPAPRTGAGGESAQGWARAQSKNCSRVRAAGMDGQSPAEPIHL